MTLREDITARELFNKTFGITKLGAPTIKFAEDYHKEKIRRLLISKYNKRRRVHSWIYTVNDECD